MVLLADVSELEVGGEKQTKRNFEKKLELFLSLLFHLSLSLSLFVASSSVDLLPRRRFYNTTSKSKKPPSSHGRRAPRHPRE